MMSGPDISADRAHEPFGVWILPGVAGRCEDFFDLERNDTRPNVGAINAVPIPHEIARSFLFGEGLDNLLGSLGCRGVVRHVEVQHLPTIIFQCDEHEPSFEGDRGHGEEVNRNHLTEVICAGTSSRSGRTRPRQSPEDSGDSAFGNLDAEHFQLAMNPGCAPQRVGGNHPFDETWNLDGRRGSAAIALVHFRPPSPEPAKPFALPADDRVGLDVNQGCAPARPQQGHRHPEQLVDASQYGLFSFSLEGNELNAESSVLHRDGAP